MTNTKKDSKSAIERLASMMTPIIIITIAILSISILLLLMGKNPFEVYGTLINGAFGSERGIIDTINKAVPICLSAFAVAISKKAGVFNIGVEGQIVFGAIGAAAVGIYAQGLPAIIHIPLTMLGGMLFGVIFAAIPTWMFQRKRVNLLVIFLLMNTLASKLSTFVVISIMPDSTSSSTASLPIAESAWLPNIYDGKGELNIGILVLLGIGALIYIIFYKTVSGYELEACGKNRDAAGYAGIKTSKYMIIALLAGGALSGLAASIEVQGTYQRLYDGFSPGYGFDGIPIALLSGGNPIGMLLGSILFGALRVGSNSMQRVHDIPTEIISIIQGILVVLIACEYFLSRYGKKLIRKKKEVS